MRKVYVLAALLISAVTVLANGPVAPRRAKTSEIKIMSYNIRYKDAPGDDGDLSWDARREPSVTMVLRERPDLIGYQEPWPAQIEDMAEGLPQYDHVEMGLFAGERKEKELSLMVMWLRDKYDLLDWGYFWLSETPDVPSRGWDSAHNRVSVWVKLKELSTKKEFFYLDTHLDHKGSEARYEGAKLNVEKMKEIAGEDAIVFISGDMNATKGHQIEPYMEWMQSARLTAPETDDRPSFNGFGRSKAVLDHIFYRNASPMKFETLDGEDYGVKYISDHYPIVCTFEF